MKNSNASLNQFIRSGLVALLMVAATIPTLLVSAPAEAKEKRKKEIFADARLLRSVGIETIVHDDVTGVAYARITPDEEARLTEEVHSYGRCGGFAAVDSREEDVKKSFRHIREEHRKNMVRDLARFRLPRLDKNPDIVRATEAVEEGSLKEILTWISSFPTRYNRADKPNVPVVALAEKLDKMVKGAPFPIKIDMIEHKSTPMNSLRVHIEGSSRPQEIIVLGAHYDSINLRGGKAPGADDDGSGSANLIEALRILIHQKQPERSIDIFFYAGEESGLLGSGEIAKAYKQNKQDVVAVLQLDMTSYAGSGEFVIGSMTDFTSPWLREYFKGLNELYIGAKIIDDRCGYGCSDHASWNRQGYPALMPFEATFDGMNHNIHSDRDIINSDTNFRHSAMFSKIAIAMAMDLGNSTDREPRSR